MSAYSCGHIRDSAYISRIHGRVKGLYRLICVTIRALRQAVNFPTISMVGWGEIYVFCRPSVPPEIGEFLPILPLI